MGKKGLRRLLNWVKLCTLRNSNYKEVKGADKVMDQVVFSVRPFERIGTVQLFRFIELN